MPPGVAEDVIADNLRASQAAWTAWLDEGSREDISRRTDGIAVPARILAGGADGHMTADLLRREVQARIAGAGLSVVPGAGHLLPLEAPAVVAGWLRVAALQPAGDSAASSRLASA